MVYGTFKQIQVFVQFDLDINRLVTPYIEREREKNGSKHKVALAKNMSSVEPSQAFLE